jgi:hypothetical protein
MAVEIADLLAASADASKQKAVSGRQPVTASLTTIAMSGAFKDHVKANFFKGASLDDPSGLFNAGFEAKATRAIDFHEGDRINAAALKALVRAAVALNASGGKKTKK